jgi:cobalt-zinc-cadmium efflux system membrane fusion protein
MSKRILAAQLPAKRAHLKGGRGAGWIPFGIFLAFTLGAVSCAGPDKGVGAAGPEPQSLQASMFTVPENQLAHLHIRSVQKEDWSIVVRTTGTVDFDADHTTQAIAQVSGPITRILVDTGSTVEANAPLLYVSSPDVTNAVAAYRKARNRMDFETRTLDRNKDLLDHRAIAQKDFESVQADYNDASTDLQNALQALLIFGITSKEIDAAERQGVPINPQLAVRSPIKGIVVQKLVFPGQLIQAGSTVCFVVSDPSTVWVQGHIYEKDLTAIRIGDPVTETNPALPGAFPGVVSYIGAMVDPATRTTPVRIVTGNPKGLLKKDLIVDALIQVRTKRKVLTVPTSAVLYDSDNIPFVYIQTEGNRFAQRQAAVGAQQDGKFEILSGLKEGEKVVSEGAVFLQFANTYQR